MTPAATPHGPTRRGVLGDWSEARALSVLAQPASAQNRRPPQAATQRTRQLLQDGWVHTLGDPASAARPDLDVSVCRKTSVPHTWNAKDLLDDEAGFHRGPGWYRRTVQMTGALQGKRVFLYFEGAFQVADVHVDGVRVSDTSPRPTTPRGSRTYR